MLSPERPQGQYVRIFDTLSNHPNNIPKKTFSPLIFYPIVVLQRAYSFTISVQFFIC